MIYVAVEKEFLQRLLRHIAVVFASECQPCVDCGEPFCIDHGMHYADCDCIGPSELDEWREEFADEIHRH